MFRLRFADGGELQLTEAGSKKRAGVWLLTPEHARGRAGASRAGGRPARRRVARGDPHLGLAAAAFAAARPAADRRASAAPGRTRSCGPRSSRRTSSRPRSRDEEIARLATAIRDELARGLELRLAGSERREDLPRPQRARRSRAPRCGTPIARVDFEEHTIYYCPTCQTDGRVLKDRRLSRLLR